MSDFDFECASCTEEGTCALGHTSCDFECPDFESVYYKNMDDDYEYDAYDWFDDYLDDLNDGEILDDDEW